MFDSLRKKERTFCGMTWEDMDRLMDTLCWLDDDSMITDAEQEALNIAIQCVCQIMNRMIDGKRIEWD